MASLSESVVSAALEKEGTHRWFPSSWKAVYCCGYECRVSQFTLKTQGDQDHRRRFRGEHLGLRFYCHSPATWLLPSVVEGALCLPYPKTFRPGDHCFALSGSVLMNVGVWYFFLWDKMQKKMIHPRTDAAFVPGRASKHLFWLCLGRVQECVGLGRGLSNVILTDANFQRHFPAFSL